MFRSLFVVTIAATVLAACAPIAAPPRGAESAPAPQGSPTRVTMGVRYELISAQSKALNNSSSAIQKRLFNASLAMMGQHGLAPRVSRRNAASAQYGLLAGVPGRVETTYRLRTNLTWHDRRPITAEDFAFAYKVYASKAGLAIFQSKPQDAMAELVAPDPRTVVIRWRSLYPEAGSLGFNDFDPLPRHLLQPIADLEDGDALAALPFWTREYVSSGPYKLDRWEPGTLVDLSAFDGHALGRPRIDRITVRIIPDENTMLTNVLAGNVDVAVDNSLRFEHGQVLKREWVPENKGTVLFEAIQSRNMSFQRALE